MFPRPGDEQFGLFVQARLSAAAALADIEVLAPVARVEYGNPGKRFPDLSLTPQERMEGPLRVLHPRWLYPPLPTFTNSFWLHLAVRGLARRVRERFPFQLIDAHFGFPEAAAADRLARAAGVPFTVTLRGNETMHGRSRARRAVMQAALRRAARVITVSGPLRDYAIELGVAPGRAIVIPNGIDGDVFYPRDREAERKRLGMMDGPLHLLSAGYLIERKGHHLLIEALAHLRAGGVEAVLWVVGGPGREGDFAPVIRQAAARTGMQSWVRFPGAASPRELAAYMTACDLFCLASSREGWPNVVNEALACGAPVVASRVGAVPEMLLGGQYGVIADSLEPRALAAALAVAAQRRWDRAAIARWGQSRSWAQTAREVVAVWRECIEEAASKA